jgi:Protein of unknown function (DUF4065)
MPLKFRPKIEKILELLLHLAHVRPGADKYQAVKFFYLADREHLNRYGRPITYEAYFALPYGPVASNAMDLLEEDRMVMKKAGIESLPFKTEIKNVDGRPITYIREPLRKVDYDLFSKSDIQVFDEIIRKHGDATFDDLFKLTHKHFAYLRAWDNKKPGVKRAEMYYEDMIEDKGLKQAVIEDMGPVAPHIE